MADGGQEAVEGGRRCADCGEELLAKQQKTAKRCRRCALLVSIGRSFTHYARPKRCRGCGKRFRPIHADAKYQCVDCHPRYGDLEPAPCNACKGVHPPVVKGVPLCIYCASGTETQEAVVKALSRGRIQRREANDWKEPQ